jgi:hypothetical protein
MNRIMHRYLILIAASAAVMLMPSCGSRKYKWNESYSSESKQPYGTYVTHEILKDYNKDGKLEDIKGPVHSKIHPSEENGTANYVFIGESFYLGHQGTDSLLEFVKRGNRAFISAKTLPDTLVGELRSIGCSYENYGTITDGIFDTVANLNFYHPSLLSKKGYTYRYKINKETIDYKWYYVLTNNICDTNGVVASLGDMNGHVNFVQVPYGKGFFFIHTTPLVFTNYYMIGKQGLDYSEKAFTHLAPGPIYWDEFSRVPVDEDNDPQKKETPFRYILSQPPLKWALYLTMLLLLVFILFRSKRRQRVIPILESKENTSLEFVQTIGTLYFQQTEHRKLAIQEMKLFLQFIRNRYSIPTNNVNSELFKKISIKSQVPEPQVETIFEQHQWIESMPEISDANLITFHQSIDNFYKTCK